MSVVLKRILQRQSINVGLLLLGTLFWAEGRPEFQGEIMPGSVRKDDKAKRIALDILGPHVAGLYDSFGKKKRFVKRKDTRDERRFEGERINTGP